MSNLPLHPTLEVSLPAIARNYQLLRGRAGGKCGAVVKADAYGLGAAEVAPALFKAGCLDFFVATLEEGVALRGLLPGAEIYIFHGCRGAEHKDFAQHRLIPVLNSLEQVALWGKEGPCALHVDTGMNRLGLSLEEAAGVQVPHLHLVMSHLACAGEPDHPMNARQLSAFKGALAHFPGMRASFVNSSGLFLGPEYLFDLGRPGCSLYGISPNTSEPNPMENVAHWSAPVLQYRTLRMAEPVGYGATADAKAGSVLATVELGYADGFQRILSNKAKGFAGDVEVPLLGRVSMDMLIFDVTAVPEEQRTPELRITLLGEKQPVDALAGAAGTIGYEIFTRIGARVKRVYS